MMRRKRAKGEETVQVTTHASASFSSLRHSCPPAPLASRDRSRSGSISQSGGRRSDSVMRTLAGPRANMTGGLPRPEQDPHHRRRVADTLRKSQCHTQSTISSPPAQRPLPAAACRAQPGPLLQFAASASKCFAVLSCYSHSLT